MKRLRLFPLDLAESKLLAEMIKQLSDKIVDKGPRHSGETFHNGISLRKLRSTLNGGGIVPYVGSVTDQDGMQCGKLRPVAEALKLGRMMPLQLVTPCQELIESLLFEEDSGGPFDSGEHPIKDVLNSISTGVKGRTSATHSAGLGETEFVGTSWVGDAMSETST